AGRPPGRAAGLRLRAAAARPAGPVRRGDRPARAEAPGVDMTAPEAPAGGSTWGGSLGWGQRPALLLIDMMRAYFTPGSPFDLGSDAAVKGCARLLAAARAAGLPVVHTRVRYRPGASDGGLFVRKVSALRLLAEDVPGDQGEFA